MMGPGIIRAAVAGILAVFALGVCAEPLRRPNILLVVADDLGYSDLGVYGSEIPTPAIDGLAARGVQFTHFHTSPSCSPTRAMLLTGVDHHLAGLGNMRELSTPQQRQQRGFEGYLNTDVVTVATRLRDVGYRTVMAGKWHLGQDSGQLPADRGFDRSFALMQGAANHFDQRGYASRHAVAHYRFGHSETRPGPDFYSTQTYTDHLIRFLQEDRGQAPFFAYLAYTAPHWPLQAPPDEITRHRPVYQAGWDQIRAARFARMQKLGLVDNARTLPERWPEVAQWDEMSVAQQQHQAEVMAVYAAMITAMDAQIKRLIEYLDEHGELDNTVIVFLSDNGAEARGLTDFEFFREWIEANYDANAAIGSADSFVFAERGWGQVSVTPHRLFKSTTAEGGLRSPLIVVDPRRAGQVGINSALVSATDLAAGLLEWGHVAATSGNWRGREVHPPSGHSLVSLLAGSAPTHDRALAFELNGHAALIQARWKALRLRPPYGDGNWQLYDLSADIGEIRNLADADPQRVTAMAQLFAKYASRMGLTPR